MATAVALARAVADVAAVDAGLKWPNDLVVGDRKLAGILAERDGDALVVGAGCNVNWASFPPELAATATACNLEAGHAVDRDALLDRVPRRARVARSTTPTRWSASTGPGWRPSGGACASKRVRGDDLVGVAVGVTDDGALVVRDDAGTDHTVTAADVVHLRPA